MKSRKIKVLEESQTKKELRKIIEKIMKVTRTEILTKTKVAVPQIKTLAEIIREVKQNPPEIRVVQIETGKLVIEILKIGIGTEENVHSIVSETAIHKCQQTDMIKIDSIE